MKKFLLAALLLSLLSCSPALAEDFDFYQGADGREPMKVTSVSVGCRFGATAPFSAILMSCPSWSDDVGRLTARLYKWEGDYAATVSGEPLAERTWKNYADNVTLTFRASAEAGEYLLLLCDGEDGVGVWGYTQTATGTYLYTAGVESEGVFAMTVRYTQTPEVFFQPLEASADYSVAVTTPDPVVYDSDHPTLTRDARPDTWAATDALGRELPDSAQAGQPRDRFVGLFYWTWHSELSSAKVVNLNDVLEAHPEAKNDYNSPVWEEYDTPTYHWNEPIYGHYVSTDKWVLRRQAELLAAAGVDVVIFDNTNSTYTWQEGYTELCEAFIDARNDGVKTPQIAFMLPFSAGPDTVSQLRSLYLDVYRQKKYQELWFYWKGKPLIMAYAASLDTTDPIQAEIGDFFTFRAGQPAYDYLREVTYGQWGWLSNYPQSVYYHDGVAEQTTVGVAQNYSAEKGLTAMNGENVFGRSYAYGVSDTRADSKLYGANFAQQWEYALEVDPEFVFITGWNEWIVSRYENWGGVENAFPDECNDEYSRDIEPTKGDLQDHYYYQMVSYIRRYKGVQDSPAVSAPITIATDAGDAAWEYVYPRYVAYAGDTFDRDSRGYGDLYYTDDSGRNDIVECRVARDDTAIWFTVECAEEITAPAENWMRLLIDVAGDTGADWESFQYIVNRQNPGETALLERSLGGWTWETVCPVEYSLAGHRLTVKIPRAALHIVDDFSLSFKWMDNTADGDMMSAYVSGDSAPIGRFKYTYSAS